MRVRWLSVIPAFAVTVLGVCGCASTPAAVDPTAAPTDAPPLLTTLTPELATDPYPGWTTYTSDAFGLSFRYPSNWYGPEVYEFEDGVRLEVGSDVVYPYGTGLDERQPGAQNAYSIVIQYTLNRAGWTLDQYHAEQPWFRDHLAVLGRQDGESSTTARSLTTRVRGLTMGHFTGVEFISTLSETAQTERFYMRTAFLMDERLNVVQIIGSPENVEVADPANWRAALAAVDDANLTVFQGLVGSIMVE